MDPKAQKAGEDDADFFERLELEREIDAYFVILPLHAKVLGTIFEGGMLRRDFKYGANPRIVVLYEDGFAEEAGGAVTFLEKGKRTQYLKSLVKVAEHSQAWESFEDLADLVVERALAEDE